MVKKLIYGNVELFKIKCKNCGEENLVGNKKKKCYTCGEFLNVKKVDDIEIRLMGKRTYHFPKKLKNKIREHQNNKCYWCDREFDKYIIYRGKTHLLKMHVDHVKPFSYRRTNEESNLVGACSRCNFFKHAKYFNKEYECREYLKKRWQKYIEKGLIVEI